MSKPTGTLLKLATASLKMQSPRETNLNSRVTHIAAAFVLAVVLGGCGGGGGGGSPALNPVFGYPTLPDAVITSADSGVTSNYTKTGNQLAQQTVGTVNVIFNSPPQSLTLIVTGLAGEPAFSFTVPNPVGLGVELNPSPLTSCPNCLRDVAVLADDNQPVRFIYLDPASAAALTYSTLGLWSKSSSVGGPEVGAAFSIGVVTRAQDLPIFGSAIYNGLMVGRYANGVDTYVVGANATATASFFPGPNSSVAFSTSGTVITLEAGGPLLARSGLDLIGTLNYSSGSNSLAGTLTTLGAGPLTGTATAKYYGPPTGPDFAPAEFGGAFFVKNGANTEQMNGSFALKQ